MWHSTSLKNKEKESGDKNCPKGEKKCINLTEW